MTSRREAVVVLADAAVERTGGDLAAAVRLAAEDPDLVPPDLRGPVGAVLRDRLDHPDPFASFPH